YGYPFNPDIYFQRFDSSLTALGSNLDLTTEPPDTTRGTPDIDLSSWAGGVVVWADYRHFHWDIYGQIIASDGSQIGNNFKVNDDFGNAQQHAPKVSTSNEGWFVVTWYDNREGNDDIFAQLFDSSGAAMGSNIKINTDPTATRQAFPDVATDGRGRFTVVWVDWRNGIYPANPDIYSARFDTTGQALTGNLLINTDGSVRAQREASISADRMGNVSIIWADSTSTSWDIVGQMIDVDGVVREINFQANVLSDSMQLHPDVALDGNFRYVTWADNRNGNLDVYASIKKYNDPTVVAIPPTVSFTWVKNQTPPAAQTVDVEHTGYNSLPFVVIENASWLTVSPVSSMTPANLTLTVSGAGLDYGAYQTEITLVDTLNHDSSTTVSVSLVVTGPTLSLAPTNFNVTAFEGLFSPDTLAVSITEQNGGTYDWTASTTSSWITVLTATGVAPDTMLAVVDGSSLPKANYLDRIIVSAADAIGSPDTVAVTLQIVNDKPMLLLQPDSLFVRTNDPSGVANSVTVLNGGIGNLNWSATVGDNWLQADRPSGGNNDIISFTVPNLSGKPDSTYVSWVDVVDTAAFNESVRLRYVVELFSQSDTLVPTPESLFFFMAFGGASPPAQQIQIGHTGSVPLDYAAQSWPSWLSVTPAGGRTPDSLSCGVATDTLAVGTYAGKVVFLDTLNHDTSQSVAISLVVSGPELAVVPDSLHFVAFYSLDEIQSDSILIVSDVLSFPFDWSAQYTSDWFSLSKETGTGPEAVLATVTASHLPVSTFASTIEFDSPQTTGGPDTVLVRLDVINNVPLVAPSPDSLFISSESPQLVRAPLVITNQGTGTVNWTASSAAAWAVLDPTAGSSDDTVHVSIDAVGLSAGNVYSTTIRVVDSNSFRAVTGVPLVFDYLQSSGSVPVDTISLEFVTIEPGQPGELPIEVRLHTAASRITLPLSYDSDGIYVDSVEFGPLLLTQALTSANIDSAAGRLELSVESVVPSTLLPDGRYPLAYIHVSAIGQEGTYLFDTATTGNMSLAVFDTAGVQATPVVASGMVLVSPQTSVEQLDHDLLPADYALAQNYPNPFNPSTTIEFEIPGASDVVLEVFNILGQVVAVPLSERLPAGYYRTTWDSRYDSGRVAPSGIYFYRLKTAEWSMVRKMVLVK
ncbi:MAG: T9SS type A sorting domain-containing protein, partial [Candidatus Zixiibacteriota bacterium]